VVECNHGLALDSDYMSLMHSNTKDGRNTNFAMNYSFQQCVSANVRHLQSLINCKLSRWNVWI